MSNFIPFVANILRNAGWHEKRNAAHALALHSRLALFPKATEALAEFGGLCFGSSGTGIDCPRRRTFIDEQFIDCEEDLLPKFENILETKLVVLGQIDNGYEHLIIDKEGRTYTLAFVSGKLHPLAPNLTQGIEFLVLGKKLSRQEIEATWPTTAASGASVLYTIAYNYWGVPNFEPKPEEEQGSGAYSG